MAIGKNEEKTKFGMPVSVLKTIELSRPKITEIFVRDEETNKINPVPVRDMKATVGNEWENVIYYQNGTLEGFEKLNCTKLDHSAKAILALHWNTINSCFIASMEECGRGVFAKENLDNGVFLANGLATLGSCESSDALRDYTAVCKDQSLFLSFIPSGVNMASLFQHAPTKAELKEYWLDPKLKVEEIATANVLGNLVKFKDLPSPILMSGLTEPVKQGEPIMRSYGWGYWIARNEQPSLFYRNGKPIPTDLYRSPRAFRVKFKDTGEFYYINCSSEKLDDYASKLSQNKAVVIDTPKGLIALTPDYAQDLADAIAKGNMGRHWWVDLQKPVERLVLKEKPLAVEEKSIPPSSLNPGIHKASGPAMWSPEGDALMSSAKNLDEDGKKLAYTAAAKAFQKIVDFYQGKPEGQGLKLQSAYCRLGEAQYELAVLSTEKRPLLEKAQRNFAAACAQTEKAPLRCRQGNVNCKEALAALEKTPAASSLSSSS